MIDVAIATAIPAQVQADFFGVAHRGGRVQGPENTLEVFQLTIDLGVTPWLETDACVAPESISEGPPPQEVPLFSLPGATALWLSMLSVAVFSVRRVSMAERVKRRCASHYRRSG